MLQLQLQPAEPDLAHLIIELDRNFPNHLIKEGKRFKSSEKDKNDTDIIFSNTEQTVLNQASIQSLRTLFRAYEPPDPDSETDQAATLFRGIYVAPGANLFDSKEEPFPVPNEARWETLGSRYAPNHNPDEGVESEHDIARDRFLCRLSPPSPT